MSGLRRLPLLQTLLVMSWIVVAFGTAELVDVATEEWTTTDRWVVAIAGWVTWAAGLMAALIRRPMTLTAVRLITSGTLVWAVVAALSADDTSVAVVLVGVVAPGVATAIALTAELGSSFVDGASYGDEQRFLLRPPATLVIGAVPVAWLAATVGPIIGPLLLVREQWVLGAICTALGLPAAWLGVRALHGLARRWLVFVPAGVVVHDFMTSREPFLMVRNTVATFDPAAADTTLSGDDLIDATQGASGLVMLIELHKAVELVPRATKGDTVSVRRVNRVAFVPSRPGRVMEVATDRGVR